MSDVRFYHLLRQSPEQAMPALLVKALGTGKRIVVKAPDSAVVERLNDALWSFDTLSFVPHGSAKDGRADQQPIWITDGDDNPNGSKIAMSIHGADIADLHAFDMVCYMFDGNNSASVQQARAQWKNLKEDALKLTYWQQTEKGWEKKA